MSTGNLVVLSGPSAVGKSTVVAELIRTVPNLYFSVSMTTRDPRPGEVDGKDYFFVNRQDFERSIEQGKMLEWAEIHGGLQLSGTPADPVLTALEEHRPVLVEVDLAGARAIKKIMPEATSVFLAPPSWDVLVERLTGRNTESEEVIEKRLQTAREELAAQYEFDYTVINESVDKTVLAISELLTQEH